VIDAATGRAAPFDAPGIDPAPEGALRTDGIEIGPDDETIVHNAVDVRPAFAHLIDHVKDYTPEWASRICDVPTAGIRRVADEFLAHARVGETMEIEGVVLPFRPVAIALAKTVNNGWGGYECCWARTLLACLVGALEVPGGALGTTVRLNRPADNRWSSVRPGPDGFMDYPMNPTAKDDWIADPLVRSAYRTLVALVANSAWSQGLGPIHLAWMMQNEDFENLPVASPPDVWFVYRTNPAISFWDTKSVSTAMAKFPVHGMLCLHARRDQPHGRCAAARLHRSRRPAAVAHRRHQICRAVLGFSGLRVARSGGAAARRGEGLHLDCHRTRPPHWSP
jgi:phenylacetyl-CoA:acceptor oxidoreductase